MSIKGAVGSIWRRRWAEVLYEERISTKAALGTGLL